MACHGLECSVGTGRRTQRTAIRRGLPSCYKKQEADAALAELIEKDHAALRLSNCGGLRLQKRTRQGLRMARTGLCLALLRSSVRAGPWRGGHAAL